MKYNLKHLREIHAWIKEITDLDFPIETRGCKDARYIILHDPAYGFDHLIGTQRGVMWAQEAGKPETRKTLCPAEMIFYVGKLLRANGFDPCPWENAHA